MEGQHLLNHISCTSLSTFFWRYIMANGFDFMSSIKRACSKTRLLQNRLIRYVVAHEQHLLTRQLILCKHFFIHFQFTLCSKINLCYSQCAQPFANSFRSASTNNDKVIDFLECLLDRITVFDVHSSNLSLVRMSPYRTITKYSINIKRRGVDYIQGTFKIPQLLFLFGLKVCFW